MSTNQIPERFLQAMAHAMYRPVRELGENPDLQALEGVSNASIALAIGHGHTQKVGLPEASVADLMKMAGQITGMARQEAPRDRIVGAQIALSNRYDTEFGAGLA